MTNHPKKDLANELARERNRQASDRTLMAWIRTALSLNKARDIKKAKAVLTF